MDHEEAEELLASSPWSRLDGATRQRLQLHLDSCPSCQSAARFDLNLEAALAPLRAQPGLARRALEAGSRAAARPSSRRASVSHRRSAIRRSGRLDGRPLLRWPAACALLLLGLTALYLRGAGPGPLETGKERGAPSPPLAGPPPVAKEGAPPAGDLASGRPQPGPHQPFPTGLPVPQGPSLQEGSPESEAPAEERREPEPTLQAGAGKGQATLHPAFPEAWEDRDTLRLADGAVGEPALRADFRLIKLGGKGAEREEQLVLARGLLDSSRFVDLGGQTLETASESLEERQAVPVRQGGRCLLRLERDGNPSLYLIRFVSHKPGQSLELDWSGIPPREAQVLVAQAREIRERAVAAGSRKREALREEEGRGGILATPPPAPPGEPAPRRSRPIPFKGGNP